MTTLLQVVSERDQEKSLFLRRYARGDEELLNLDADSEVGKGCVRLFELASRLEDQLADVRDDEVGVQGWADDEATEDERGRGSTLSELLWFATFEQMRIWLQG